MDHSALRCLIGLSIVLLTKKYSNATPVILNDSWEGSGQWYSTIIDVDFTPSIPSFLNDSVKSTSIDGDKQTKPFWNQAADFLKENHLPIIVITTLILLIFTILCSAAILSRRRKVSTYYPCAFPSKMYVDEQDKAGGGRFFSEVPEKTNTSPSEEPVNSARQLQEDIMMATKNLRTPLKSPWKEKSEEAEAQKPAEEEESPLCELSQEESCGLLEENITNELWFADEDPVQWVFNSTSLSSSSSSYQSLDKEKKHFKSGSFTSLPHFTDLTTYMIKNVINFGKTLTMFRALVMEDQISLLKGATFEIILIHFNMFFNEVTGIWECGPLQYCMDDAFRAGFQHHLLDPMMNFHYTLRKLRLHEEEYVLMQALSLFSPDRPGVTDHKVIDRNQETLALTLKTYIEAKRNGPEKNLLFPKIMGCLTEMRSMNEEYTKQVLKIQDMQPEVSPLWLEIISKDT